MQSKRKGPTSSNPAKRQAGNTAVWDRPDDTCSVLDKDDLAPPIHLLATSCLARYRPRRRPPPSSSFIKEGGNGVSTVKSLQLLA